MGDDRVAERLQMVETQMKARAPFREDILRAILEIPRHLFALPENQDAAYEDHPLPLAFGQTISQPFVVALMTQLLMPKKTDRILEVGLGSGYSAAILSRLAARIYTIDREASFLGSARERFKALGIENVEVRAGDGSLGWPEEAPFDAISVSAGAPRVPQPLLDQLKIGGILVLPVGDPGEQTLLQITKRSSNSYEEKTKGSVRFVPLVGREGWSEGNKGD